MKTVSRTALFLLLVLGVSIVATRRDFSKRNLRFFPGMVYATSNLSQSANPVFADGKTQQRPVPGTIPVGKEFFPYPNTPDDRQKAGRKVKNPFPHTPEIVERGKLVFTRFCSHCHGMSGGGDGPVAQKSLLTMSLLDTITRERRDGSIFHIITYGRLYMPAHGGLIGPEDRWKVIHYLRELQDAAVQP